MASRNELRLLAPDETTAQQWANAAIQEVRRIEAKYSRYRDDSVVSTINRAAGKEAVAVDEETAALLDFAAQLHADSDGLFDLTSGVLRRAWNFQAQRVPAQSEIDALLPLVGWSQLEWHHSTLRLPRAGMEIDLGGIGKEYAADRAAAVLLAQGARYGFVNLGGDVRGLGVAPGDAAWSIGIARPRAHAHAHAHAHGNDAQSMLGTLELRDGAVATSGDYERFFEAEGRRYCHILNPHTGWPTVHWQSVSVAAPLCVAAGACATLAMLMPQEQALQFLAQQNLHALLVDANGKVWPLQPQPPSLDDYSASGAG